MMNPEFNAKQDREWLENVQNYRTKGFPSFARQWQDFNNIFAERPTEAGPPITWHAAEKTVQKSNLGCLMRERGFKNYHDLHRWSVENRGEFWQQTLDKLGLIFRKRYSDVLANPENPKSPGWLSGAAYNIVESCFQAAPEKTAIIVGEEGTSHLKEITYGDLEERVNRVANGLQEHGFAKNDAIALYMPMTVECVAAYLGVIKSGCRVVSVADSYSPAELKKRLRITQAKAVITVGSYQRGGKTIDLYTKVCEAAPARAIVIDSEKTAKLRDGDISWNAFLSMHSEFETAAFSAANIINVLFSSGTTGEPKAIPWTQLTPIKAAMDGYFHHDIHPEDIVAWPTNIGWMMGPWLIFATFINKATLALYNGAPHSPGFCDFVKQSRISILGTIPSLVRAWRTLPQMHSDCWPDVRIFSSTGEPSNVEDYLWLCSLTGYRAPVIEYCGGTEIGGGYITGTVVQPASPSTFTTPALGLDFVILDENDHPVANGEMGEVFLVPPSIGLSETLLNKSHDDVYFAGCPTLTDGTILRRHGDHLAQLHGGFFRAQGRADDSMNLGGIKVSSREIEQVINMHEAVFESAAVAFQPKGEGAEQLIVFVVLASGKTAEGLQQQLNALLRQNLNPLFKIADCIVLEKLPRTASNKVMHKNLREEYRNRRAK